MTRYLSQTKVTQLSKNLEVLKKQGLLHPVEVFVMKGLLHASMTDVVEDTLHKQKVEMMISYVQALTRKHVLQLVNKKRFDALLSNLNGLLSQNTHTALKDTINLRDEECSKLVALFCEVALSETQKEWYQRMSTGNCPVEWDVVKKKLKLNMNKCNDMSSIVYNGTIVTWSSLSSRNQWRGHTRTEKLQYMIGEVLGLYIVTKFS